MVAGPTPELSPGEWAVLGALATGPAHGFAVAQLLSPSGAIGRVWAVRRPVVYQSLKKLVALRLVAERAVEPGVRGPRRTVLAPTPAGRRAVRCWMATPVEHVRDVRSELLLKLAVIDRAGGDPLPLLAAQRERLERLVELLDDHRRDASGFEAVLASWRLESSRAALRFVEGQMAPAPTGERSASGLPSTV